jgi:uncharacterized RDD family membrane protein YckC
MNKHNELIYSGFWIRVGAFLIDTFLILLATSPFLSNIYDMEYYFNQFGFHFNNHSFIEGPIDFFICYILPSIAIILFWKFHQATPGKMAIHSKILDAETGEKPSTAQCIGRYFAYIPSLLFLGLGFIWIAFDKRKQGWHDKMAGTVVVRNKNAGIEKVEFRAQKKDET